MFVHMKEARLGTKLMLVVIDSKKALMQLAQLSLRFKIRHQSVFIL